MLTSSIHFFKKLSVIVILGTVITMHSASSMENKEELEKLITQATNNASYATQYEAQVLINKINEIQNKFPRYLDRNNTYANLFKNLEELVQLLKQIAFPLLHPTFHNEHEDRNVKIKNLIELLKKFKNELEVPQPQNNNNNNNNNQHQGNNALNQRDENQRELIRLAEAIDFSSYLTNYRIEYNQNCIKNLEKLTKFINQKFPAFDDEEQISHPENNKFDDLYNLCISLESEITQESEIRQNTKSKQTMNKFKNEIAKLKGELQVPQPQNNNNNNNNEEINNNNQPQEFNETLFLLREIISCKDTTLATLKELLKSIDDNHEEIALIRTLVEENGTIDDIRQILEIHVIDVQINENNNNNNNKRSNNDMNNANNNNNNNINNSNQESDQNKKLKIEEKVEDDCSICLDSLLNNGNIQFLPCVHKFHTQCINDWLKDHETCPICRKPAN